jgi:hypothetical protein
MCWDTKVNSDPIITMHAATPLATTHYGLCWDDKQSQPKVDLLPILELATAKIQSVGITAVQYDMCWDDQPSTLAVGHEGNIGHLHRRP